MLLVGVGALGTHIASTLARAGIGQLWLVDRDVVELDNLQRQILFTEAHAAAGHPKALAAAEQLQQVNSDCSVLGLTEDFDVETFEALPDRPHLIVDGTDNFPTRYLLNDLAVERGIPWIYGGAVGARGSAMAVLPGTTPCLRCMMPQAPPGGETDTCETAGVIAPAIATVAAFQCAQALKILVGKLHDVARGVLSVDLWHDHYALQLRDHPPRRDCPSCGRREFPALRQRRPEPTRLCGRDAVQVLPPERATIDLQALAQRLEGIAEDLHSTPHMLRFRVEGARFSVFPGGRALLFGIADTARARVLYDRYVGAG